MTISKPAVGAPCNGCGICCRAQVCSLGSMTLRLVREYGDRAPGPCPAIRSRPDGSIRCGLIERPRDYAWGRASVHDLRAAAALLIGSGSGCDEPDGPQDDDALAAMQQAYLRIHSVARINRAMALWFGVSG